MPTLVLIVLALLFGKLVEFICLQPLHGVSSFLNLGGFGWLFILILGIWCFGR
ncbi:hypothetical protein ACN4EG_24195 [Alkalinema pantanalense CENA528]|uniref:hypothetical protein n=1 Tax=Alkalinema pantanalense TaxID=1620705 RepID=UPI003D7010D5